MSRTVLQIPLPKELKISAEKAALDAGFSSLQEIVRIFMKRLSTRSIDISFRDTGTVKLSKKNEERYIRMTEDFKKDRNVYHAKDFDDFIKQLNAS